MVSPVTREGTIVVEGLLASVYTSVEHQGLIHSLHSIRHSFASLFHWLSFWLVALSLRFPPQNREIRELS